MGRYVTNKHYIKGHDNNINNHNSNRNISNNEKQNEEINDIESITSNLTTYFALSATAHLEKIIKHVTKLKKENKIIINQNNAHNKCIVNQTKEIHELKNVIKTKIRKEQMLKKCLSIKRKNSMRKF